MGANRKGLLVVVIAATSLLLMLQLGSGIWLFIHKLTFEPSRIAAAYLGDPEEFIAGKTVLGVLQTAVPHILGMGTVALIAAHLLPYCGIGEKTLRALSAALYLAAFGEIAAPLLILSVSPHFAWLKLVSFVVFEGGIAIALLAVMTGSLRRHG
ncbi:MAG: hypothetical protein AB7S65_04865 [Sulfuricurvum sp.]